MMLILIAMLEHMINLEYHVMLLVLYLMIFRTPALNRDN